jgi:hypothetical protein
MIDTAHALTLSAPLADPGPQRVFRNEGELAAFAAQALRRRSTRPDGTGDRGLLSYRVRPPVDGGPGTREQRSDRTRPLCPGSGARWWTAAGHVGARETRWGEGSGAASGPPNRGTIEAWIRGSGAP